MNGWSALEQLLHADPQDVGCAEAMDVLHIYVELAATDATEAHRRYPGVAAHLLACGPCEQDFEGLLRAVHDATS